MIYFTNTKQDGPSLESSSYLNITVRLVLWTRGPSDPGTLGLLDFRPYGPGSQAI